MAVYPLAGSGTTPAIYPTGSLTPSPAYSHTVIPEIWSGKLLEKFYASTVLAAISNTDYEGEIKNQGDTVHIRTKPTITINDYLADGGIVVERPSSNIIDLLIDKGKYFATILDDVMEVQSDLNLLGIWSDDASQQMKIKIDADVLLGILGQADAANRGATAGKISASINLGVTGTPVAVSVGHRHTRRCGVASSTCCCAWARRSTSRTSPRRDAGWSSRRGPRPRSSSRNSGRLTCPVTASRCCATDGSAWSTASRSTSRNLLPKGAGDWSAGAGGG